MKKIFLILLTLLTCSALGFADEAEDGYIQITVKNNSVFPKNLQVRDDNCTSPLGKKTCKKANRTLKSKECRENRNAKGCKQAKTKLDNSDCIAGLVYEGMVEDGESIQVSVCKSPAGYGAVSLRAINMPSPWIQHRLISAGETIEYP
jgi:hypothetical protein